MKKFISFPLVAIALIFMSPLLALGKGGKTPPAQPTPAPQHTVIGNISADSITVDTGKSTRTYKIDRFTQCYLEGTQVPVTALKAGMRVSVSSDSDALTANAINASGAPKGAAAPKASPAAGKKKK